jgi:hypothetical protein
MAVTLTGSGGLFTILKLLITAADNAHTAHGTTTPTNIDAVLAEMSDVDTADTVEGISRKLASASMKYERYGTLQAAFKRFATDLVIDRVTDDAGEVIERIDACLDELIRQMESSSDDVDANVVSVTVPTTPGADSPTLIASIVDGEGKNLEGAINEDIVGVYSTATGLSVTSGQRESNKLLPTWPAQSAVAIGLSVEEEGLLTNYSFDDDDDREDTPDDWIIEVGTIDTTVNLTAVEVQTIAISGTPTSGHWTISHTRSGDSYKQTTVPLAYDATAADVEEALEALDGFSDVSVSETGTSPNVTHTVTFESIKPSGDQALLTTANNFDTGSILVSESTAGEAAYTHRALAFTGDGAQLTAVRLALHSLELQPNTVYGISVQMQRDAATTGTVTIRLVDGAGSVINDDAGTANSLAVDVSTLSSSAFTAQTTWFRTPKVLPEIFYLEIKATTAITNTKVVYIDDVILAQGTQAYTGGPFVVLFANDRDLQADDRYVITVANDWGGKIQTWFWRWFGRLLPSDTGGAETITDP